MTAQTAGNVGEDRVAVLELDRKGRAWKNLLDRAKDLERRLFGRFGGRRPGGVVFGSGFANCYDSLTFVLQHTL
ncbi:MAG TPA: hypothetical protein VIG51_08800 [Candidatus Baltobacteraceae bacterium]|jgi:hypothetical protein